VHLIFMITLAEEADIPAIVAISNWAAEHTPANFATAPETDAAWLASFRDTRAMYPWLVERESDGRVAGFAKAGPHRARGAYRWTVEMTVYVDPERHGRGVGNRLYTRLIPILRDQGYVTLLAGITPPNPASIGLHEKHGFVACGTYHRAGWKFGRWHDVAYFELQLLPPAAPPRDLRPVAEVYP
jgi:phosphinothricin acetyltransferase